MIRTLRLLPLAALLAATPALAGTGVAPATPETLIAAIERAEPLDATKLHALFGPALRCPAAGCERGPVAVGGLTVRHLDFRHGAFGSLLVLDGFACLPAARVKTLYPDGTLTLACTDGVMCSYHTRSFRRRAGAKCGTKASGILPQSRWIL